VLPGVAFLSSIPEQPALIEKEHIMATSNNSKAKPATTNSRMDAFLVDEYEVDGKKQSSWSKIGAAWPHSDGAGFRIVLKAIPTDGVIILRTPEAKEQA
jgi:hypothetical protein